MLSGKAGSMKSMSDHFGEYFEEQSGGKLWHCSKAYITNLLIPANFQSQQNSLIIRARQCKQTTCAQIKPAVQKKLAIK